MMRKEHHFYILDKNLLVAENKNYRSWLDVVSQRMNLIPMLWDSEFIGILILDDDGKKDTEKTQSLLPDVIGNRAELAATAVLQAPLNQQLEKRYIDTLFTLVKNIDLSDTHTSRHAIRTATLVKTIASHGGCSRADIKTYYLASILHDIGKVGIPKTILKKPTQLSDEEWDLIKRHPVLGAEIINPATSLEPILPIVRAHHEKYNGSGYPYGLEKEAIPLGARILTVADAYTTMTDGRVYRAAYSIAEAVEELKRCAGTHFDPRIVDTLLDVIHWRT